ncbi:O-antigen ligase-like membrane protein [Desulfallas thermosapovorans DSM 6562]|uniref:O-antigen ligase-like membrane protein n=2 Tax=Desulfallas thermosapovorans TaxID=58137 RepID=A0A5S4ZVJ6_9FIRM|nr:O-antigen ligase-like membrane protein [Desulfallas thermosapovorans DSM 6562]
MKNVLIIIPFGILALPPFFLGLFFEKEMSIHHYFVAAVSLLVIVPLIIRFRSIKTGETPAENGIFTHGDPVAPVHSLATSPYFMALAGLTVLYGLSFLNAVHPREALFTWLRHIDYLLTFVMVFIAAHMNPQGGGRSKNFTSRVLVTIAATGTVVALAGIFSAQGLVSIEGGLTAERLASTFQYPNSFAIYLTATLIITAILALQSNRPFMAGAYAGMVFLTCLAISGSQSRSVMVMLPLVLVIFVLGQPVRYRAILLTGGVLVLASIMAPFTVGPQARQISPNWNAFLLVLAGCLAITGAWAGLVARAQGITLLHNKKTPRDSGKQSLANAKTGVVIVAIMCVLIAISSLAILAHTGSGSNTSGTKKSLLGRTANIGAGESSLQYRFEFYKDALNMIKERPLLGWGGGGWKSAYPAYQSFNYFSTQVHNHYLHVWIEAGTAALIMLILPFIFLMRGLWRIFFVHRSHPLAPETWAIGTAALALGLHAAIDFDLSFGAISLLLWSLLALFAYREKVMDIGLNVPGSKRFDMGVKKSTNLGVPTVLLVTGLGLAAVFLAAQTFVLWDAAHRAQQAVTAAGQGNLKVALGHVQAAARLDRWSARYPVLQAKILTAQSRSSPGQVRENRIKESIRLARQAVKLETYNPEYRFFLARMYLAGGRLEKALAEAGRAKELRPWQIQSYEEYNDILVNIAVQQLLTGREESAGDTLRRVLAATQEAINKKETLPPGLQCLWDPRRDLFLTPALSITSGQSALLLGEYKLAVERLSGVSGAGDERTRAIARLWLGAALLKDGNPKGAELIQDACRSSSEAVAEYHVLKQLLDF